MRLRSCLHHVCDLHSPCIPRTLPVYTLTCPYDNCHTVESVTHKNPFFSSYFTVSGHYISPDSYWGSSLTKACDRCHAVASITHWVRFKKKKGYTCNICYYIIPSFYLHYTDIWWPAGVQKDAHFSPPLGDLCLACRSGAFRACTPSTYHKRDVDCLLCSRLPLEADSGSQNSIIYPFLCRVFEAPYPSVIKILRM